MRQRRDSPEPVGAGAEAQRFLERAKTITPTPWLRSHSRNGAGTAAARIAALAQAGLDARGRPFGPFCAREDRVSAFADPVMPLDGRIRPRSGWGRSVPTSTPMRPFGGQMAASQSFSRVNGGLSELLASPTAAHSVPL